MGLVYDQAKLFKRKYPGSLVFRTKKHADVIERHLNPGEEVRYAFAAQKNDNIFNIFETAVVVLTTKRILIGRKRVLYGYFLNSITPDMFNDLKVQGGLLWGKVHIDTVKEFVTLSHISNNALTEIETEVSTYMMEEKKKYANELSDGD